MKEETNMGLGTDNKKKVIVIQSGFSKITENPCAVIPQQQVSNENLKENANLNSMDSQTIEKTEAIISKTLSYIPNIQPNSQTETPPLNFDTIITSLFHLTQEVRILNSRIEYL